MKRLFWDYYGGDARGTAQHFVGHLGQFLARCGLADAPRGVEANAPGHAAAWVDLSDEAAPAVVAALRPKRQQDL